MAEGGGIPSFHQPSPGVRFATLFALLPMVYGASYNLREGTLFHSTA